MMMQLRDQWRGRRKETKQRTHYAHRANKEQALDVSLKLETVYKNDTFNKIYKQGRFYRSIYQWISNLRQSPPTRKRFHHCRCRQWHRHILEEPKLRSERCSHAPATMSFKRRRKRNHMVAHRDERNPKNEPKR